MVSMNLDPSDVLLAFLNTTPVVDGAPTDVLADDGAARDWLRAHGGDGDEDLDAVRTVRDDLQRVVRGELAADALNSHLAAVRYAPRVDGAGLRWAPSAPTGWSAGMVLAWGETQRERPHRLRPCANEACHLFLLDRSRGGTGRWCSMSGCGNRMKARRHYQRAIADD